MSTHAEGLAEELKGKAKHKIADVREDVRRKI
jgi:uncharacterized protein YjbJ (UPF0337 family)